MLFEYEYQDLNIKIDIVLYAKNKIKESKKNVVYYLFYNLKQIHDQNMGKLLR